jgi:type VI secretion system protein ImpM
VSGLAVFAFGKLPAHGDFVARGLSAAERDAWDEWASAGLARAREALGGAFDEAHDRAQPWRFAFGQAGAGRFGAGRRAGVLAPSIDAAGRRYVIVVGAVAASGLPGDGEGAAAAEILEGEIYRAFEQGCDIDQLTANAAAALSGLAAGADGDDAGRFWTLGATPEQAHEIRSEAPPADLLPRMMLATAERGHG